MASLDDFWLYIYEYGYMEKLTDAFEYHPAMITANMGEGDEQKLQEMMDKINSFDFEKLKDISYRLKLLERNFVRNWSKIDKLRDEYKKIMKEYDEIENMEYRLTGENKYLLIIFTSFTEEEPFYQSSRAMYRFLSSSTVIRDKKQYPITDELLLDMFGSNPDFYQESLFLDQEAQLIDMMSVFSGMFETYFNKLHPIKHKDSMKRRKGEKGKVDEPDSEIRCQESQNGILKGLVHKIGYTGYKEKDDEFLMKIINSKYLEIQFKERNPNSGVFTTVIGHGKKVKDIYGGRQGIYFILSLKALEDFDYWGGEHALGARKKTSFYKGICHKCDDGIEKYSAAERLFMASMSDKENMGMTNFYELMFSADLSLRRYLEAIYVPWKSQRDILLTSELVPERVKSLIIDKIPDDQVFRKGCEGEKPKKINKKTFDKMVKVVEKREKMDSIPEVNFISINTKRKVKIMYDPLKSGSGTEFPTPE